MKVFYFIVLTLFFLCGMQLSAQDINYGKSNFNQTGDPTTMVTPDVSFLNSGLDSIEVLVKRIFMNLPANWSSCFCFISCHTPAEDTLRFFLAPGEKAIIGVGFNTDSVPGIGYVKITVEQIGGTQKDTLTFSGSTMLAGITENTIATTVNVFPNPASDKVIIHSSIAEKYNVLITDPGGNVLRSINTTGRSEQSLNELAPGVYYLSLRYESGKTETKRIIKTN